jgi:hypothetical protein
LLGFGQVARYLGYNALLDFFPTMNLKPNETCADNFCIKRQKEYSLLEQKNTKDLNELDSETKKVDLHPDNEYGNFNLAYLTFFSMRIKYVSKIPGRFISPIYRYQKFIG